jgi:hypothetical protein
MVLDADLGRILDCALCSERGGKSRRGHRAPTSLATDRRPTATRWLHSRRRERGSNANRPLRSLPLKLE